MYTSVILLTIILIEALCVCFTAHNSFKPRVYCEELLFCWQSVFIQATMKYCIPLISVLDLALAEFNQRKRETGLDIRVR